MSHLIGFVIIGLSILSVVGFFILELLRYRRDLPDDVVEGIPVLYLEGAEDQWEGLGDVIIAMRNVLEREYPGKKMLENLWIEVVPQGGLVKGFTVPTGRLPSGKGLNGTLDRKIFYAFKKVWIAVVRQLNGGAARSALFHEVAEHHVPNQMGMGLNSGHDPVWHELTVKMREELKRISVS